MSYIDKRQYQICYIGSYIGEVLRSLVVCVGIPKASCAKVHALLSSFPNQHLHYVFVPIITQPLQSHSYRVRKLLCCFVTLLSIILKSSQLLIQAVADYVFHHCHRNLFLVAQLQNNVFTLRTYSSHLKYDGGGTE